MEATGISEAAQAVEVGIKGIDSALRLTGSFAGWTINSICQLVKFILSQMEKQKKSPEILKPGEMELDKLMRHNSEYGEKTCVMQIDEQLEPEFISYCQANNLSYSFLFDVNRADGQKEVAYSESQAEAFGVFIRRYPAKARTYSFTDYLDNATPEGIMEADKELSAETKKTVERRYSEGVLSFKELSEKSLNTSAVTLTEEQYTAFKEKNPDTPHCILLDRNKKIAIAITDADYKKTDAFLSENGLKRQNLAEFLNENKLKITPDDTLTKSARAGSSRRDLKSVMIDERQIANINPYSANIRIADEGASYITVPLDMIKKSDEAGKWNVILPEDENIHVYDKLAAFKENTTLSSYMDNSLGKEESVELTATKTISATEAEERLTQMEKHFEEKKNMTEVSLTDKYIYEPEKGATTYDSSVISQNGEARIAENVNRNMTVNNETAGISETVTDHTEKQTEKSLADITINIDPDTENPLLVTETEKSYFTRIPGSHGEDYIYINKEDAEKIRDGKTIHTKLDLNKEYKIYDKSGNYKYSRSGSYLVENHYLNEISGRKTNVKKTQVSHTKVKAPEYRQHVRSRR